MARIVMQGRGEGPRGLTGDTLCKQKTNDILRRKSFPCVRVLKGGKNGECGGNGVLRVIVEKRGSEEGGRDDENRRRWKWQERDKKRE